MRRLEHAHLINGNVAESNIRDLTKLMTFVIVGSCDKIRLREFQGGESLISSYDASTCAVRAIPDLKHLTNDV